MKKNKMYLITWHDAQSDDGWTAFNDKEKISNMVINTAGFYIDQTKDYLRLALSIGQNNNGRNRQYSGTMAIPKACILKKRRIK